MTQRVCSNVIKSSMRIRAPRDFWSGLLFIAIALFFITLATRYRFGTPERMGPAFFPIAVGILLGGLGAILVGRALVFDGAPLHRMHLLPLAVTMAAVVLFGLALQWLGLVIAIVILVVVGSYADRATRLTESIGLAAFLSVFSVAIFVWLLGLPLPVWPEW
jgi:Tripartite tricarboxylate transporter TctB family